MKYQLSAFQKLLLTVLLLIGLGTLFLSLPISYKTDVKLFDRFFVATSAVCVTGLSPVDTYSTWTSFGLLIIILLIQVGGLGLITFSFLFSLISGKKIDISRRNDMKNLLSAFKMGGTVKFVEFTFLFTLIFELAGALILLFVFIPDFSFKAIPYSIFHSISAFCNAGFDTMGGFNSLNSYKDNILLNAVITVLIISGGIGFATAYDIKENKLNFHKYHVQSKMIILSTLVLICLPALYFFFFEFNLYPLKERLLLSFFQSVTTRTAGFSTADLNNMSESSKLIMIILMLIGASPGSTAGGFKNVTLFVVIVAVRAVLKNESDNECFNRRIDSDSIRKAITIIFIYFVLFGVGGCLISQIEGISLMDALFESASALGTVGLTLSLTPKLSVASKSILICLMIIGRVGGLNFIYAAFRSNSLKTSRLLKESVNIG